VGWVLRGDHSGRSANAGAFVFHFLSAGSGRCRRDAGRTVDEQGSRRPYVRVVQPAAWLAGSVGSVRGACRAAHRGQRITGFGLRVRVEFDRPVTDTPAIHHQLVSRVESVYYPQNEASAHHNAIVRKESTGVSSIPRNEDRIVRSWRATVRDGCLCDSPPTGGRFSAPCLA
jgi:hypothetical protein